MSYRLKIKKYRMDVKEFWGILHGTEAVDFCKPHLQDIIDPTSEVKKILSVGAASHFVMKPIERQVFK